jgi:hypothetical protein
MALEVKWPVEALTLKESAKIERSVTDGVSQVLQCHELLRDRSAILDQPADWPDLSKLKWFWFVATPGQLVDTNSVVVNPMSYRQLWLSLPASSLDELIKRLLWRPTFGVEFDTVKHFHSISGIDLETDAVRLLDSGGPFIWKV